MIRPRASVFGDSSQCAVITVPLQLALENPHCDCPTRNGVCPVGSWVGLPAGWQVFFQPMAADRGDGDQYQRRRML